MSTPVVIVLTSSFSPYDETEDSGTGGLARGDTSLETLTSPNYSSDSVVFSSRYRSYCAYVNDTVSTDLYPLPVLME